MSTSGAGAGAACQRLRLHGQAPDRGGPSPRPALVVPAARRRPAATWDGPVAQSQRAVLGAAWLARLAAKAATADLLHVHSGGVVQHTRLVPRRFVVHLHGTDIRTLQYDPRGRPRSTGPWRARCTSSTRPPTWPSTRCPGGRTRPTCRCRSTSTRSAGRPPAPGRPPVVFASRWEPVKGLDAQLETARQLVTRPRRPGPGGRPGLGTGGRRRPPRVGVELVPTRPHPAYLRLAGRRHRRPRAGRRDPLGQRARGDRHRRARRRTGPTAPVRRGAAARPGRLARVGRRGRGGGRRRLAAAGRRRGPGLGARAPQPGRAASTSVAAVYDRLAASRLGAGRLMKVLSVVGARPQFVKLAPIAHALAGRCEHVIVHTGQHYDERLSQVFFDDLAIPRPDVDLGIGSGGHGAQTGAMLAAMEPVLQQQQPGLGAGLRRHQLDARRRARGGEAAPARRAPRGRAALVQPADARGAQPGADRPRGRPVPGADRGRDAAPGRRGAGRALAARRRRDDRRLPGHGRARSATSAPDLPDGVATGDYVVATIHRPDNTDDPDRLARDRRRARRARPTRCCCSPIRGWSQPRERYGHRPGSAARCTCWPAQPYPELLRLVAARPARRHRLRRPAEGGVPAARPVHDGAHRDRVDRDGRPRLERPVQRPGRPRRRGRPARTRPRPTPRRTATGTPPSASPTLLLDRP